MKQRILILPFLLLLAALILPACTGDTLQSAYLEANRAKLDQPVSGEHQPHPLLSNRARPARGIAENLAGRGLIVDARLFEAYVRVNGLANSLQAGAYPLSPSMTIPAIAQVLQRAVAPEIIVRVGEGWRLEQTADYLTQTTPLDGAEYRRRAEAGDLAGLHAASTDSSLCDRPGPAWRVSSTRTPTACRLKARPWSICWVANWTTSTRA